MTFHYLATPYSRYPHGLDAAFRLAVENLGLLIQAGVRVFSPIVHTHPVAMQCGIDPLDHSIWLPADVPLMRAAGGLIMLRAEGWEQSYGMNHELQVFRLEGKPVVWMDPGVVPEEFYN